MWGEQGAWRGGDVRVAGRGPLLAGGKVDPELDAVEETTTGDQRLGRPLDVKDHRAGRLPLGCAVGVGAARAGGVLVLKGPVDHVGDGREAAMRVPCRTLGLAGAVLHLAHLVHVNEGVEVALVEAVKGARDGKALAFDTFGRRGDGEQGTLDGGGRVGVRDAGQRQDVFDGNRGHCISCNRATPVAIPEFFALTSTAMKIGVMIEGQEGLTWEHWFRIAERVESLGLDSLWRSDHFFSLSGDPHRPALECWTSLTALAQRTQRIRFRPLGSPRTFRHPALLARMAAAVDLLSSGRLRLGVGAGWNVAEHYAFAIALPPPTD